MVLGDPCERDNDPLQRVMNHRLRTTNLANQLEINAQEFSRLQRHKVIITKNFSIKLIKVKVKWNYNPEREIH